MPMRYSDFMDEYLVDPPAWNLKHDRAVCVPDGDTPIQQVYFYPLGELQYRSMLNNNRQIMDMAVIRRELG